MLLEQAEPGTTTAVVVIEREPFAGALVRAVDRSSDLYLASRVTTMPGVPRPALRVADVVYVDERSLLEQPEETEQLWALAARIVVARTGPAVEGGQRWIDRGAAAVISRTATPDVMLGTMRRAAVRRVARNLALVPRPASPTPRAPAPHPTPGPAVPLSLDDFVAFERRVRDELAAAMHDGPLQLLLAARQEIEAAEDGDELGLGRARQYVNDAALQLRDHLRDQDLPDPAQLGLAVALRRVAERQAERASAELSVELPPRIDAPKSAETLVSVTRELLTNAVKHADATRFFLSGEFLDDGRLQLRVADDGRGFTTGDEAAAAADGHVGLATVRRRLRELGADLDLQTAPGAGTVFTIVVAPD